MCNPVQNIAATLCFRVPLVNVWTDAFLSIDK